MNDQSIIYNFHDVSHQFLHYTLGSYQAAHTFGGTRIPIAMDYVNCSGSEFRLWDCIHFTHSYSGCSHSDDAGVSCQSGIE